MPLYSDLIRIESEYNYSANIQFDMENDSKLLRFIPNETTIGLLREYFIDITRTNTSHHARILYGSYGTGKSHFLTVLSMLLGKVYTDGIAYKSFLTRVSGYDNNLSRDIDTFISDKNRKPFLVVPIVFDFDDFDRCIYFSLKKRLEAIGKKVSFKTFFDQALGLIEQWKSSKDSNEQLERACNKAKVTLSELERSLAVLDKHAELTFQKVFSAMTYGVKYIYEVSNLTDNIIQANEAISDEYTGIVFIFDEFGRYIEDNMKSIKVKAVQDLAEFCDHGVGNNHIILVSHKEIGQYTQRYGKSVAAEWKKVEGRYKATPINDKQDQCLSLIRNVLTKDENTWALFRTRYEKELNRIYSEAADFRGFLIDSSLGENPFEGGFPLHPIALFALDKLSKRVAQNERTFFTYLASKDDNGLYRFLNSHDLEEFCFVGIDEIYDYFEPNIKSTQSDISYEWFKQLQTALSKCNATEEDDSPATKILKVIATIGIINDSSALVANKATILRVIDCPKNILANALEGLCESKIIKYSGAYDRYDFFEASIFNIDEMIAEESQQVKDDAVVNILNEEFIHFALYPYDYNRTYRITRVFFPVFATIDDIQKKSFQNKFGKYYDGLLVLLLCDQGEEQQIIINASTDIKRSIVFASYDVGELKTAVKQYIAVKYLESQKATFCDQDPAFEKELAYFKEELLMAITNQIGNWKNTFDASSVLAFDGQILEDVHSFSDLSIVASTIMNESYPDALIVNNELINKNSISGSITSAKKNVIQNIINGKPAAEYFGVSYLSPDYIAVRSVLAKNGFINVPDDLQPNSLPNGTMPQKRVQDTIGAFISEGKSATKNFEELYSELKSPPYGLRNGYLSLLFANALIPYKKSLIISSHSVEQEITVDLFEEIARRPQDYEFTIADWDKKQIDYLDSLEQIFKDFINEVALSKNRLKAIYDAMLSHYKNISKFSRTTQVYVSEEAKAYRRIIEKSAANYSTFLFAKINSLGKDYYSTAAMIKRIRAELDDGPVALSRDLTKSICDLCGANENQAIATVLLTCYEKDWKYKRSKSFDYYTNAFLDLVEKLSNGESDYDLILKLSKTLTGFELVYWNDSHKDEFIARLHEVKERLDAYENPNQLSATETKLTLVTSQGNEKSLVFDRNELSDLSMTVKNKIQSTFKNYGLSITYDDKVQILLSILEDLTEGK